MALIVIDSLGDFLTGGRGCLTAGCGEYGPRPRWPAAHSLAAARNLEASISESGNGPVVQTHHASRSGLERWAMANPMVVAGLWFAAVAGTLVGQLLFALPAVVAQARLVGGLAGWLWGTQAVATVYLAPLLLAWVFGSLIGAAIVLPGLADAWVAAARGALIAILGMAAWLAMLTWLVRSLTASWPAGSSEAPPDAFQAAGYILLPIPFLVVGIFGGGAGYLLHAIVPKDVEPNPGGVPGLGEADTRRVK